MSPARAPVPPITYRPDRGAFAFALVSGVIGLASIAVVPGVAIAWIN